MRTFTKSFLLFVVVCSSLLGCKKDEEVAPKNSFSYNGKDFDLSKVIMIDYGLAGPGLGYNIDLLLLPTGITVNELAGNIGTTTGKGDFLYFEIFSAVKDVLADGEYIFDPKETFKGNTFDYATAVFNADYTTNTGEQVEVTTGKLNVKKEGNVYILSFDCEISGGKKLTGFYKGPIKYYSEK